MKKPVIGIIPTFTVNDNDPYQDKASFVSMYSEKIKESGGNTYWYFRECLSLYFYF